MRVGSAIRLMLLGGLVLLLWPGSTYADPEVWGYSKQDGPGEAEVGGGVSDGGGSPPSGGSTGGSGTPEVDYAPPSSGGSGTPTYDTSAPTVSGGDEVAYDYGGFEGALGRTPGFPAGTACLYFPESPGACPVEPAPPETLRGRRGRARPAPIDPYAVAESIARSMPLLPGEIRADPGGRGWTGVPSWFWLEPAPRTIAAVAVLGPTTVVVTAVPSPAWNFGDGAEPQYGAGRPYRRDEAPDDGAVAHRYETRCLAGDSGRNPYVLDSCTASGYRVAADVAWTISFVATGPIPGGGPLPSRTTSTDLAYPVNEVRSFLGKGDGPS